MHDFMYIDKQVEIIFFNFMLTILINWLVGWLVFYVITTFEGYSMPNLVLLLPIYDL